MNYIRKSDEEIEKLISEFQKESLYRAYCKCHSYDGVIFTHAELWNEAKLLASTLKSNIDANPNVWVMELYNMYRNKFCSVFEHVDSIAERAKLATKICNDIFMLVCLMVYHEMKHNVKVKEMLTYKQPVSLLVANYGFIKDKDENMYLPYLEYSTQKSLYASLHDLLYLYELEEGELFVSEYKDKLKRNLIKYDYCYFDDAFIVDDESGEAIPTDDVETSEWDGKSVFKNPNNACMAKKIISEKQTSITSAYHWVAFYMAFEELGLLNYSIQSQMYKEFAKQMNDWFDNETKCKCSHETLSKWSKVIKYRFHSNKEEEELKKDKNFKKGYDYTKELYEDVLAHFRRAE